MTEPPETTSPGLCARCRWVRIIRNRKGSAFILCRKSAEDPAFPRYPRLPVLECSGFEEEDPGE